MGVVALLEGVDVGVDAGIGEGGAAATRACGEAGDAVFVLGELDL